MILETFGNNAMPTMTLANPQAAQSPHRARMHSTKTQFTHRVSMRRIQVDGDGEDAGLEALPCDSQEEGGRGDFCVPGEYMRAAQLCRRHSVAQQRRAQEPACLGPRVAAAH